jgi:hypothetical protein
MLISDLQLAYAKLIKKFPCIFQYSYSLIWSILDMLLSSQVIKFVLNIYSILFLEVDTRFLSIPRI